ncbi:MAG: aminotransferase class I/II-fold pyridoxal phosphate-dependent enzyme, partial [Pseudomonadota bacterium]
MSYTFSAFGSRFDDTLGTLSLMRDLGDGAEKPETLMLGGGNPARIPAVEAHFGDELKRAAADPSAFVAHMAAYADPAGDREFRRAIVRLLNREYGFGLSTANVCLTNGSQNGFFALMNMLGGRREDGVLQRILLPITPEYLGYADLWVGEPAFAAHRPTIELLDQRQFKYHVDFDAIDVGDDIGALCLSRPTNPTGNVVTDDEMRQLDRLARDASVPLIVDCAYGDPFPGINRGGLTPSW